MMTIHFSVSWRGSKNGTLHYTHYDHKSSTAPLHLTQQLPKSLESQKLASWLHPTTKTVDSVLAQLCQSIIPPPVRCINHYSQSYITQPTSFFCPGGGSLAFATLLLLLLDHLPGLPHPSHKCVFVTKITKTTPPAKHTQHLFPPTI